MTPRCLVCDHYLSPVAREALAAYAHEAWAGWKEYEFSKGTLNPDGTWTMPAWAVERWTRQMRTKYADLPELEKESDRAEADKMLALMRFSFDGWCDTCAGQALAGLLGLRDTTPEQIAVRAACFADWNEPFLAKIVIGTVPFSIECSNDE